MPFGFKTAPACFQRVMNFVLKDQIYVNALVYLDDVICWGDSLEEMESVVTVIVNALDNAGLKLNGEKSCFLTRKLEILGHWVESGVIKPDYGKLTWLQLDCKTVT